MGYQALLFCPDEKLARVVTQVFSDLEFSVEPVNEPFAAVKKLMAQRYDAIVVDCENEQNATLLFKSARNSSSNQSSLALALVEGQAGVAKAYRIGANLVLTKPINVEQAKGTLRVARGLLRKTQDAVPATAKPVAATPRPAPAPAEFASAFPAAPKTAPAPPTALPEFEAPEFEPAVPAIQASAETPSAPEPAPAVIPQSIASEKVAVEPPKAAPAPTNPAPAPVSASRPLAGYASTSIGSAAAPAPAKEVPAPAEKKSMAPEFVGHAEVAAAPPVPAHVDAPSFGALQANEAAEGSGSKKILLAVAAVIAVALLAYFGWTKFGHKETASTPAPAPAQSLPTSAPSSTAAPVSTSPEPAPAASSQPAKPSAATAAPANSSAIRNEAEPEVITHKPSPAPIVVKSAAVPKKTVSQADDSAPAVPSPLAVAPANDKHITSLVASAPITLPKAAPTSLRISQGVSQGLLIKRVQPRYPQNALSMRIQGAVLMEATIDKEGNVRNLKVQSGDPILARAASEAVKQWRYKPYYLDGDPVEIQTQITVNFKLPN